MERMLVNSTPLFSDITWGAGGSTAELSLEIAKHLKDTGHVSNLHMTCTNMDTTKLEEALKSCHDAGIRNIVALRGDPPAGEEVWKAAEGGFNCALDLVKYIRTEYGEDFGISVAGYPEGHPDAIEVVEDISTLSEGEKTRCSTRDGNTYVCRDAGYVKEMKYLKEKIDAGGDFILTQMFFDSAVFGQFVKDCREYDITCPVIPGIMCITGYAGFNKMTGFCKTRVPAELAAQMDAIKDDADAVKKFGVEFGTKMCQNLLNQGTPGLHFYTLNLEKCVYGVTDALGWTSGLSVEKSLDADSKSMAAVGSAWARVGDSVKSIYGTGTVTKINQSSGAAVIVIDSWKLAGGQQPTAFLQKGSYGKIFA
jgi:methylenetetrahydrofolate reductase (NADPH)